MKNPSPKTTFAEDFVSFFEFSIMGIERENPEQQTIQKNMDSVWNPLLKKAISFGKILNAKYNLVDFFPTYVQQLLEFFTIPLSVHFKKLPKPLKLEIQSGASWEDGEEDPNSMDDSAYAEYLFSIHEPLYRPNPLLPDCSDLQREEAGDIVLRDRFYQQALRSANSMAELSQKQVFQEMYDLEGRFTYNDIRCFLRHRDNSCIPGRAVGLNPDWLIRWGELWDYIQMDLKYIYPNAYRQVAYNPRETIYRCPDCGFVFYGRYKDHPTCLCSPGKKKRERVPIPEDWYPVNLLQDFAVLAYFISGSLECEIERILLQAKQQNRILDYELYPGYGRIKHDAWDFKLTVSEQQRCEMRTRDRWNCNLQHNTIMLDAKFNKYAKGILADKMPYTSKADCIYVVPQPNTFYPNSFGAEYRKTIWDNGKHCLNLSELKQLLGVQNG